MPLIYKNLLQFYQNSSYEKVKMPFVKEKFIVEKPTPAFLYVMHHFDFTQREAQRLIGKGRLLINNKSMFDSGAVIYGEVEMVYFKAKSRGNKALFQTKDFMVFEKPSGVLVHPNTMATPYSVLDEIRHYAGDYANAVHRIDMETSGLVLASKHKDAERFLKNAFEIKSIKKSYLAWVDGEVRGAFTVKKSIKINNDYSKTKHKVFIDDSGKKAQTDFVPLCYDDELDTTLVACYPATGRTHQIRIHLFHMKHPILGDPIYGTTFETANRYLEGKISKKNRLLETGASRLMLHAHTLAFTYGARYYIESSIDFSKMKAEICDRNRRVFNQINL